MRQTALSILLESFGGGGGWNFIELSCVLILLPWISLSSHVQRRSQKEKEPCTTGKRRTRKDRKKIQKQKSYIPGGSLGLAETLARAWVHQIFGGQSSDTQTVSWCIYSCIHICSYCLLLLMLFSQCIEDLFAVGTPPCKHNKAGTSTCKYCLGYMQALAQALKLISVRL